MGFPVYTYTFTNSTTADASQVNQDFTDILNGVSDGTKNISVSAGTFAGALNANGSVTLGASSSNNLTINASLNSSIVLSTQTSFDIGSATVALRSVYLGSADATAHSVRLIAPNIATSYTLTLPTAVPASSNSVIQFDTGGNGTFRQLKTPTVTLLVTGSSLTYTLPTNCKWIRVRMVGGGGGAAGSGTAGGVTGIQDGTDTTFTDGSLTLTAGKGLQGSRGGNGGAGGAATISSGSGIAAVGEYGDPSQAITNWWGGRGGRSHFPGAGQAVSGAAAGSNATSYGSGGTGGGTGATGGSVTGSGGGSGAYIEFVISSPSATYTYTVGVGGNGANSGTNGFGGSNGAPGVIYIEEFYT